jgi:hypothetical protein
MLPSRTYRLLQSAPRRRLYQRMYRIEQDLDDQGDQPGRPALSAELAVLILPAAVMLLGFVAAITGVFAG